MASLGGGASESQDTSSSTSSGQTFIDPQQQQFLEFLRTQGQGVAQQQLGAGGAGDVAQAQSQQLGGAGQQFLGNLQQGGAGNLAGQQQQQLAANQAIGGTGPGSDFLQQRISQGNPFLNQQIQQLGTDIGQQFNESILPGIRGSAVQVGALGGGRQGVAEGIAAQGAQRAFAGGASQLMGQDAQQRLGAAGQLAGNALQGGQLAGQGVGQQLGANSAGIGNLGNLFNLGQAPFNAQFAPLQQFGNLLGGPTVLSQQQQQSQSQGTSSSFDVNAGFGSLFGA